MSVHLVINCIISCTFLILTIRCQEDKCKWTFLNIQNCSNDAEMPYKMYMHKYKVNRTHVAFDFGGDVPEPIDDSYAVRVDIKRKVTGAWKQYMIWGDDCLPCAGKKFAEENVKRGFIAAGIDPPEFPVPKGRYDVKQFVVDTTELPQFSRLLGMDGEWSADVYVIKDGRDLLCHQIVMLYESPE
ncbi:uncharacterized protein LOC134654894 [Cydia amplana]|uniref:uncharacterized protein LOC134654894 n=1 Tax=Cydia amplana TaxID=1869771 RepID=UPI002FE51E77